MLNFILMSCFADENHQISSITVIFLAIVSIAFGMFLGYLMDKLKK